MDEFISIGAVATPLLVAGGAIGLTDRRRFSWRWLLAAVGLVLLRDALLTRGYGHIPNVLPASGWNWEGELLALAATLAIAALPVFGWRRAGLTIGQAPGSLRAALPTVPLYLLFFIVIALVFPFGHADRDAIAFHLTLSGVEEETFFRGLLLLALDRAFGARRRFLGVEWGWGAVLSCLVFGLANAIGYENGLSLDPMTMALTVLPAFIAVWLRLRTGSVLLPIVLHNAGNSLSLLL